MGQNADLVIHEATFEDDLQQEAVDKLHATTSEAVDVCEKMNAKFLMMNHFSSRYPKVPQIKPSHYTTSCVAFDLMTIHFNDFIILPLLLPVMQLMFKDIEEDEDNEGNESPKSSKKEKRKSTQNPTKKKKV